MSRRPRPLPLAPPERALDADVLWVLRRAFAGAAATASDPMEPGRAAALALRMAVGARIASRHAWPDLARELAGAESAARSLALDRARAETRDRQLRDLAAAVVEAAMAPGVRCVFLKYAALRASGFVSAGARHASDVDVLVAPADAGRLAAALVSRGFVAARTPGYEHQLAPLVHPSLGMVEIHGLALGVRLQPRSSARSAQLGDLAQAGLTTLARWDGVELEVPSPSVLVAHALVHGLAQHGLAPRSYPLGQTFADLCDLRGPDTFADEALGWTAGALHPSDARGALELCRALADGEVPRGGRGRVLLLHWLASILDERYGRSLRLRSLARPLSDRRFAGLRALARAVAPSAAELAVLYDGEPAWRARLRRPFDLVRRAVGRDPVE